jgi:C4-dicarboxylate transporter/malic acid transport protein
MDELRHAQVQRECMSAIESKVHSREIGPNLFASVMGTGIIANAAIGLPMFGARLELFATAVWVIAAIGLVLLTIAKLVQAMLRPHIIKRQFNDPVMSQFFGAPPMAFLTIAGGMLLVGINVIDSDVALTIAWGLWWIGTLTGLMTAIIIPYHLFTIHEVRSDGAFGGWLMPIVPPMVSAAIGALLIPHVESVQLQQTMLFACYAMFGMSLFGAMIIITMIWSRLAHLGSSGGTRVPTLWIVLGPLGQSITAAGSLGAVSLLVLDVPIGNSLNNMAILYGVPAWGFAFFWSMLASLLTLRAIKLKMPYALTWWAFTFPVGTCVTGTTQLALHTKLAAFEWASVALFAFLLFTWFVAAFGTVKGLRGGKILVVPNNLPPVISRKGSS